jgi:hypothetical protein
MIHVLYSLVLYFFILYSLNYSIFHNFHAFSFLLMYLVDSFTASLCLIYSHTVLSYSHIILFSYYYHYTFSHSFSLIIHSHYLNEIFLSLIMLFLLLMHLNDSNLNLVAILIFLFQPLIFKFNLIKNQFYRLKILYFFSLCQFNQDDALRINFSVFYFLLK